MPKAEIQTDNAPAAIGPYSQAVRQGDWLYISGQIPLVPGTGTLEGGDIQKRASRILENLKAIVEAAGGRMHDIVKVNIYLTDMNDFAAVNEVYGTYFEEPYPARACIAVAGLPKGTDIEMEGVANLSRS